MSRPLLDLPFTAWSYDRILRWRAENTPQRPFICFEDGAYQSYGELWQSVCQLAKGLANAGVQRGDCVALFATNSLPAVHVWLAINVLGATDAPINPAFRGQPLVHALNMLKASIVIADRQLLPVLQGVGSELTALSHIYYLDHPAAAADPLVASGGIAVASLSGLLDVVTGYEPAGAGFDSISSILMTSGTSGPSKGVMVPHAQAVLIAKNSVDGMRVMPASRPSDGWTASSCPGRR
jgi:crotonobetaine/carnitine-CoA ligase